MATPEQVRLKLADYLGGRESLDALNRWLIAETWDVPPDDKTGVRELFGAIQLAIAEHSANHLAESELRSQLAELLSTRHNRSRAAREA